MKLLVLCAMFLLAVSASFAQSLDDLNIQIHGYATQGFLYTTQNNMFTADTSDGSPAWTDAVLNISSQPMPKLRIGVQGRYFLLGNFGGGLTLDWAAADYKFNDRAGVRFGKVKTPTALFNEIQDIDPSYLWSLLPQSIYPLTSRNTFLTHYGGVVYGTLSLGEDVGKLDYRGFGGSRIVPGDDGAFVLQKEAGVAYPNGFGGRLAGGALHWRTPLAGLMIGVSDIRDFRWSSPSTIGYGAVAGTASTRPLNTYDYFGKYERGKVMAAAEYCRFAVSPVLTFPGAPPVPLNLDYRQWYGMASYKVTDRLSAGVYQSQEFDRRAVPGPARFQNLNPNGLKPDTRLTILKIGVSF